VCVGSLRDVSLDVRPGEVVCVSGDSGSGKSRLLRAIADLDDHTGEIAIGGDRCADVPPDRWRSRVMMVPAESSWWADTVVEHFATPVPGSFAAFRMAEESLGWQVSRLSSGEKQRLALLRALSRRPRALLLDEPTANMDPELAHDVEAWFRDHARRESVRILWVAHDVAQIERIADRHFAIRGSTLQEQRCRTS
jgi:ABC-type iron transport system FetAB ATPase subunit